MMQSRNLHVLDVAHASGVNARTLTEYLAGRRLWDNWHLHTISRALDVDPSVLAFDPMRTRSGHPENNDLGKLMNACEVSVSYVAQRANVRYELVEALLAGPREEFPDAYRRAMLTLETIMQQQGWRITSAAPALVENNH